MKTELLLKKRLSDDFAVKMIGKLDGLNVYHAYIPNKKTGFPFIFLVDEKTQTIKKELNGFDALDIINKYVNDEK